MKNPIIIIFLISLLLVSCAITELPFEHKYVINMVLKPYKSFQNVFIDSTYRLDVSIDDLSGIGDADIFVVDEDSDTFRFAESDTIGLYYSIDSTWVRYGIRYIVNVTILSDTITEEVIIPRRLRILSPGNNDTVSLSKPPELYWNRCEGCFNNTYCVLAYIPGTYDSIPYRLASVDTSIGIFRVRDLFREIGTVYNIEVRGFDGNGYYAIMRGDFDTIDDERAIGSISARVFAKISVWVTE